YWERGSFVFEYVTAHEVAHQWWYSMVGNDQTLFPWLDEALTEYSVALYYAYMDGEQGYNSIVQSFADQFTAYEQVAQQQQVGDAVSDYSEDAYGPIVYRKGAYFFHLLSQ